MYWGIILISCILAVSAHPNGSPICDATADELRKMSDPENDPTSDAFSIDIRKKPDDQPEYEIRLMGDKYKGFLLYVEDDNGKRIGSWKSTKYMKSVHNDACNDGCTITQVNANPKTKETVFTWTPPEGGQSGTVKASVVVSTREWYIVQQPLP